MSTTVYTWNPLTDSVIEESDGSGNAVCTYTNEPSQFGPLISENRGGTTSYYHADGIGSTRLTTNSGQTAADSFLFDSWGNSVSSTETVDTPYQWCGSWGYQTDSTLNSMYVRSRTYRPSVGLWLSVDPLLSYSQRVSDILFPPYTYVANSTVNGQDPSGNQQQQAVNPTTDVSNLFLFSNSVGGQDLRVYLVSGNGTAVTPATTIRGMNSLYGVIGWQPGDLSPDYENYRTIAWTVAGISGGAALGLGVGAYTGFTMIGNAVLPGTAGWGFIGAIGASPAAAPAGAATAAALLQRYQRELADARMHLSYYSQQLDLYPGTRINATILERAQYWERQVEYFQYAIQQMGDVL